MVMAWIRTMLGPLSLILDFFKAHPELLTAILLAWLLVNAAGRIQLKIIEDRTILLVTTQSRRLIALYPAISLVDLREKLLPLWNEEVKNWRFLFIPHKFDIWPVSVTPENILLKLPLSSEWLAGVLIKDGIAIQNTSTAPGKK
jgi:hypothetical protein